MEQRRRPIAQGTGRGNTVIRVYPDRLEFASGWQSQNVSTVSLKQVVDVSIKGIVNCTLTIEVNDGRRIALDRMALPDARGIKSTIERQKQTAGLYE
jgi:hypothetical protein